MFPKVNPNLPKRNPTKNLRSAGFGFFFFDKIRFLDSTVGQVFVGDFFFPVKTLAARKKKQRKRENFLLQDLTRHFNQHNIPSNICLNTHMTSFNV